MLRLLVRNQPRFSISTHELAWAKTHPSLPNTTYDTLCSIRSDGREYAFVIGIDQFSQWPQWHRFPEVIRLCHWIVLVRKPSTLDHALAIAKSYVDLGILRPADGSTAAPEFEIVSSVELSRTNTKRLVIVETQARNVSSTEIRAEIARSGNAPAGTLHSEVLAYLMDKKLYGT